MKKYFTCILLILTLSFPAFTADAQKTDDDLLVETVELSKEVKKFGKTLGIEPTEALTKNTKEKPARSFVWIWIQKKGSLLFSTLTALALRFDDVKEKNPIQTIGAMHGDVSIYWRSENQFSGSAAVITIDFARAQKWRRVEVILHEDIHQNLNPGMSWQDNETITTALACLAALEYFEYQNDDIGSAEVSIRIKNSRLFSRNLLELLVNKPLPDDNEAKITHDLGYYKYFDRIAGLYEKSGNLKILIEDMKNAPGNQENLDKYFDKLEQKYLKTAE